MDLNFDAFFKHSSIAMKINQSHPRIKRDRKWLRFFILRHGLFTVLFFILTYNIIFINIKNNEFDETCKNGTLFVIYLVISFQHIVMSWKQEVLKDIITLMEKDYDHARLLPIHEQEIINKYVKRGARVCKQWFLIPGCGGCVFVLKNVVLITYYLAIGEPKLISIFDLVYPWLAEEYKNDIYVYLSIYALIVYFIMYSACMYTAFVPLGPVFMLHACGQLDIVEKRIQSIFKGNLEEAEEKLKDIIRHLQYIYGFVERILLSFRIIYELTLRGSTIILPIMFYEVIEAFHKGNLALEFISVIIGGILISGAPCYYSDLMMEKGEKVRVAMFSSGWERVPNTRVRKTIRIILVRALKPTALRSLFRTVCLETFADLLQQSYALFNLMNSMWN